MGARANYVIIEDGTIDIYSDKWGAQGVPAVVIDGFEATNAYIRELAPTESLMNDIWAEGGILLDIDGRALLFFGGENIRFSPPCSGYFSAWCGVSGRVGLSHGQAGESWVSQSILVLRSF